MYHTYHRDSAEMKRYRRYFEDCVDDSDSSDIELFEGILYPNQYLENIDDILTKQFNKIKGDNLSAKRICFLLGWNLSSFKIKFILQNFVEKKKHSFTTLGLNKGATLPDKYGTIHIYCNENITSINQDDEVFEEFLSACSVMIKHELIHRVQMFRVHDAKIRKRLFSKEYESLKKYLADKHEIMTRAWEIVEMYRIFWGYSDTTILGIIQHKQKEYEGSDTLLTYYRLFDKNSDEIKLLKKYMYMYATGQNKK